MEKRVERLGYEVTFNPPGDGYKIFSSSPVQSPSAVELEPITTLNFDLDFYE